MGMFTAVALRLVQTDITTVIHCIPVKFRDDFNSPAMMTSTQSDPE
jgi:hypothetical protein